jgi:hypothetical protein
MATIASMKFEHGDQQDQNPGKCPPSSGPSIEVRIHVLPQLDDHRKTYRQRG